MALLLGLRRLVPRLAWANDIGLSLYNRITMESATGNVKKGEMPKLVLYGDEASPPVRFVMMTASISEIEYHFHRIDLFKGENKSEAYRQINPVQKVPALLVEGQGVITESVEIAKFFCLKSGDSLLIPTGDDDRSKAEAMKTEDMLAFNYNTLFPVDSAIFTGYFSGKWPADEELVQKWYMSLDYLNEVLAKSGWLAGDQMRLCDLCCAATVTSLQLLVPTLERHSHVHRWLKTLAKYPIYKINEKGLQRLKEFVEKRRSHI